MRSSHTPVSWTPMIRYPSFLNTTTPQFPEHQQPNIPVFWTPQGPTAHVSECILILKLIPLPALVPMISLGTAHRCHPAPIHPTPSTVVRMWGSLKCGRSECALSLGNSMYRHPACGLVTHLTGRAGTSEWLVGNLSPEMLSWDSTTSPQHWGTRLCYLAHLGLRLARLTLNLPTGDSFH